MQVIGLYEAKNQLSKLIAAVEAGAEIVLTRNGKPVAKIVPASTTSSTKAHEALKWIRSRRWKLNGLAIRELIDAGRRF